ncbi:photosynthetic complex assembly protein PuhC [Roseovarius aestuariivivens]|uniref:photosynthetic complex assembly protein PuhC n=1 Tax=Roseovarius aestuariivivens TaxID=1888910 RepID=UPI00108032C6|nr:photosynthetic complex assembly protein PuhC [Roseovarius aestuariivivens]
MARTDTAPAFKAHDKELVPRMLVRAMFGLVATVLVLVTIARVTDQPVISVPPKGEISASRDINLSGDMAGSARVTALDGTVIADLTPQEGGFISGVYRVLVRERTKHRVALEGPVTLIRYETGRISIHDPSTGWSADLMGFGADNARAFARLLAE